MDPRGRPAGIQRADPRAFAWRPVQPGLIEDIEKGHYFGCRRGLAPGRSQDLGGLTRSPGA